MCVFQFGEFSKYVLIVMDEFYKEVKNSIQDQSKVYDSKKNCWVPDEEEGYVEGIIKKTEGDMVQVAIGQGMEVCLP